MTTMRLAKMTEPFRMYFQVPAMRLVAAPRVIRFHARETITITFRADLISARIFL